MVVVRILVVVVVLALGAMVGMWMFTGERRYLGIAWRIGKLTVIVLGIFFGLMLLERLL